MLRNEQKNRILDCFTHLRDTFELETNERSSIYSFMYAVAKCLLPKATSRLEL